MKLQYKPDFATTSVKNNYIWSNFDLEGDTQTYLKRSSIPALASNSSQCLFQIPKIMENEFVSQGKWPVRPYMSEQMS